jgi:hypothetical protein
MKTSLISLVLCLSMAITSLEFSSCKGKNKDESTTTTTDDNVNNTAPVEISSDDELKRGVTDATKDYPGVNATVSNGEVTLSGEIARDDLSKLMPSIHALHPKKVNNNLTIKN